MSYFVDGSEPLRDGVHQGEWIHLRYALVTGPGWMFSRTLKMRSCGVALSGYAGLAPFAEPPASPVAEEGKGLRVR